LYFRYNPLLIACQQKPELLAWALKNSPLLDVLRTFDWVRIREELMELTPLAVAGRGQSLF